MTVPTVPVWPQADPFPYVMPVVSDIQPFTYRDGMTFLEILSELEDWLTNTFVPEVNNAIATASTNYQNGITNSENAVNSLETSWTSQFNSYMANVNASLQALNDQAVAGLVNNPSSQIGTALRNLFETLTDAQTLHDAITAINSTITTLETKADALTLQNGINVRLPLWEPDTVYTAGTLLVSPTGEIVECPEDHTSAGSYPERYYIGNYGILAANFTYNSIQGEQVNLFYLGDGHTVAGHGPNPVYHSPHGVRDPSVIRFNGQWVMAHGWDDPTQKRISIVTSPDLINWTEVAVIDVSTAIGITQAWAPELTVDESGNLYAFFTNVNNGANPLELWYVSCTNTANLASWSGPVKLQWSAEPVKAMDATFAKVGNTWHMFYGDNNYVCHASATALLGPWTSDKVGDWAGWGINREAPELVRVGPSKWRLYIDRYEGSSPNWTYPGYAYTESNDLNIWGPLIPLTMPNELSQIVLRHGSFIRIDDRAVANQVQGVMAAGASNHPHAEFTAMAAIPSGAETEMGQWTVDTTYSDKDTSLFDLTTAGTIKFNATGKYNIDLHVGEDSNNFQNSATPHWVALHSATVGRNLALNAAGSGYELGCSKSGAWMRAGETINPRVLQNSGGTQELSGRVSITRVG